MPTVLPSWLIASLLVPVIAFHSSLQHECIHGHPFSNSRLNDLIAYLPVGVFLPYPRFKENHLTHHQRARITDPIEDPESWYISTKKWAQLGRVSKFLLRVNNTLFGRVFIGPALGILTLVTADAEKILKGDPRLIYIWITHFSFCLILLTVITLFGSLPVFVYLIAAYFGMSVLMIRTFLEHQAHPDRRARSVLINDQGALRYLFLNNNLHAVHHAFPSVAWYRLPSLFRLHQARFLEMNQGYFYKSYLEVIRKYAFTRKEPVAFPLDPR
ncbi:MAG: fatty acid desaturase [Sneathiella sp.]